MVSCMTPSATPSRQPIAALAPESGARPSRAAPWLLGAVALVWGINWPMGKATLAYLPPIWTVALRTAVGALAVFLLCLLTRRLVLPKRGDLPVILSVGVLHMTAFSVLCSLGLTHVSAGRSVVLAYTTPLWVVPGAWLLLGEVPTRRRLLGAGVGLAGLALIFNPLSFDWHDRRAVTGNAAVLLAAFCWAGSILYGRAHRWVTPPFELVFWHALLASGLLLPMAVAIEGVPRIAWSPILVSQLLYGGLLGIALASWAMTTVNRMLPAATTSIGLLGVPVVGIASSSVALQEPLSAALLAALALILGGVVLGTVRGGASRRERKSRRGRRACVNRRSFYRCASTPACRSLR
ncbi:MAG: transporter [Variovorax sp. 67-131]|jgi:drug/metabolite transporter (DMT)-like permease|nr:MAG: transporter [Variovorax sp. SCN 67-85]ODV23520.1 MAG: transporter [Variovorax sp. SCN 67-20]OJZ15224.1 MAG: transporter [Variovorax sp. 67-131]